MIRNSFCILPGVGAVRERRLWEMGVHTWDEFMEAGSIPTFPDARKRALSELVGRAAQAADTGDFGYLGGLLGSSGVWRLWPELSGEAVCLDIETDGGPPHEGGLTVAGFYSHGEYRVYVQGENLDRASIEREFADARLLVSFFGGGFDVPYLKATFPGLEIDMPHFDLCPAGHRVGLKGGLKKVEKQLGIMRGDDVDGLGGYEAVLLWRAHMEGRPGSLERLVSYNREDTVNLHALASIIYEKLRDASGLPALMARHAPERGA